jgi:hypothetical protein
VAYPSTSDLGCSIMLANEALPQEEDAPTKILPYPIKLALIERLKISDGYVSNSFARETGWFDPKQNTYLPIPSRFTILGLFRMV